MAAEQFWLYLPPIDRQIITSSNFRCAVQTLNPTQTEDYSSLNTTALKRTNTILVYADDSSSYKVTGFKLWYSEAPQDYEPVEYPTQHVWKTINPRTDLGNITLEPIIESKQSPGPNTYTLTLNANGGSVSPSSITTSQGQTWGTLPIATRTNFWFNQWWTLPTGGTQITSNSVASSNVTVYANWGCTIIYNLNGGQGNIPNLDLAQSEIKPITSEIPIKEGCVFQNWNTLQDGSGVTYTPGSNYSGSNGNLTLYAQYDDSSPSDDFDGERTLYVQYAPNNVATPIVSGTDDRKVIIFSNHIPVDNNGYFNYLKIVYNNQEIFVNDFDVWDDTRSVTLTREGQVISSDIGTGTITNIPSNEFELQLICCCKIENQVFEGNIYNVQYGPVAIQSLELSYPNSGNNKAILYQQGTSTPLLTNVCIKVGVAEELSAEEVINITIGSTQYSFSGIEPDENSVYSLEVKNAQLQHGDNTINVSIRNLTQSLNLNCMIKSTTYRFDSGLSVKTEDIKELLEQTIDVVNNYKTLYGDEVNALTEQLTTFKTSIVDNNCILDQYWTNNVGYYQVINGIKTFYNAVSDDIFYVQSGEKSSPVKLGDIIFQLDPLCVDSHILYLYETNDLNTTHNWIDDQVVVSQYNQQDYACTNTGTTEENRLKFSRLIISEPYDSLQDNQLIVLNNYQKAIQYVVENIL